MINIKSILKKTFLLGTLLTMGFTLTACTKNIEDKDKMQDESISQQRKENKESDKQFRTSQKQENSNYSGWKTQDNTKQKFSIKYPKEWGFTVDREEEGFFSARLDKEDPEQEKIADIVGNPMTVWYLISIKIEDNPNNLSAYDFKLKEYPKSSKDEIEQSFEDIEIAGIKGIKILDPGVMGNTHTVVLVPNNGKTYSFTYSAYTHNETYDKFLNDFYTILDTLEFKK